MVISILHSNTHIADHIESLVKNYMRDHILTIHKIKKDIIYSDLYFVETPEEISQIRIFHKEASIVIVLHDSLSPQLIAYQPFYFIFQEELEVGVFTVLSLIMKHLSYYQIKYDYHDVNIPIDQIIYIKTNDHLTTLHTKERNYHVYKSLKSIQEEIHSSNIIRVNKNTCINMLYLTEFKANSIILNHSYLFKLSSTYKQNFYKALKKKSYDF